LRELGHDPARLPLVVQFNKRDLPRALPISLLRHVLQLNGSTPYFEAVAVNGQGVFDTLKAIINQVVGQIQKRKPAAVTGAGRGK